jgi:cation/acetate symporter
LVVIGPTVWVDAFGNTEAIFPYKYPAIFSISIAFIGIWIFSLLDSSAAAKSERAAFDAQFVRSQTGIGAAEASDH